MDQGPLTEEIVRAFGTMSTQLQTAARYILDHPRDVALLSMREQARRAGVQPATMTRLAKHLGREGFDDIREIYAAAIREGNLGFAGRAGAQVVGQKLRGDKALAADMLTAIGRQVEGLRSPDNLERIVAAAEVLAAARRVYCLGLRSSHAVAWHFHYVLTLIGERSIHLDGIAGTGADPLSTVTGDDVLFVTSVQPYTRQTVELAEHAARRDVRIVAITDSKVAPLALTATCVIVVPTGSPSFFHTMAPAFVLSEILAAIMAGHDDAAALAALRRTDEHLASLNIHLETKQANRPS